VGEREPEAAKQAAAAAQQLASLEPLAQVAASVV